MPRNAHSRLSGFLALTRAERVYFGPPRLKPGRFTFGLAGGERTQNPWVESASGARVLSALAWLHVVLLIDDVELNLP